MLRSHTLKSTIGICKERGAVLLEAFIAILLFSMGMLALAGVQAAAIKNAADAKYRTEAAYLANQIIAQMWAENPVNLPAYAHNPTTGGTCQFGGAASANANVIAWLGDAGTPGSVAGSLPGAGAARSQITIGANNVVTVTVCWQNPGESATRNHIGLAQING
jgi:type IV pilus assembly protein PilV